MKRPIPDFLQGIVSEWDALERQRLQKVRELNSLNRRQGDLVDTFWSQWEREYPSEGYDDAQFDAQTMMVYWRSSEEKFA